MELFLVCFCNFSFLAFRDDKMGLHKFMLFHLMLELFCACFSSIYYASFLFIP